MPKHNRMFTYYTNNNFRTNYYPATTTTTTTTTTATTTQVKMLSRYHGASDKGEKVQPLLILDLGTRLGCGQRHAPAAL
jgi:hypothetical protein